MPGLPYADDVHGNGPYWQRKAADRSVGQLIGHRIRGHSAESAEISDHAGRQAILVARAK